MFILIYILSFDDNNESNFSKLIIMNQKIFAQKISQIDSIFHTLNNEIINFRTNNSTDRFA